MSRQYIQVLKLSLFLCSNCGHLKERFAMFAVHVLKKLNMLCMEAQADSVVLLPECLFDETIYQQLNRYITNFSNVSNAAKEYSDNVIVLANIDNKVGQYTKKYLTELTICVDKTQLAFQMVESGFYLEYDPVISADEVLARDDQICKQVSNETLYQYIQLVRNTDSDAQPDKVEQSNQSVAIKGTQDETTQPESQSIDHEDSQSPELLKKETIPFKQNAEPGPMQILFPKSMRRTFQHSEQAAELADVFRDLTSIVNPFSEYEYIDHDLEDSAQQSVDAYFDFMCSYISAEHANFSVALEMLHFLQTVVVFQPALVKQATLTRFLALSKSFQDSLEDPEKSRFKEQLEYSYDSVLAQFGFRVVYEEASQEYKFIRALQMISLFSINNIGTILSVDDRYKQFLDQIYEGKHSKYAKLFQMVNAYEAKQIHFSIFGSIRKASYFVLRALLNNLFLDVDSEGAFSQYLASGKKDDQISLIYDLFEDYRKEHEQTLRSSHNSKSRISEVRRSQQNIYISTTPQKSLRVSQNLQAHSRRHQNDAPANLNIRSNTHNSQPLKQLTLYQKYQLLSGEKSKTDFIQQNLSQLSSHDQIGLLNTILKSECKYTILQAACAILRTEGLRVDVQLGCIEGAVSLFKRGFNQLATASLKALQLDDVILGKGIQTQTSPFAQRVYEILEKCSEASQSAAIGYISKVMQMFQVQNILQNTFLHKCYQLCQHEKCLHPQPQYRQFIRTYDAAVQAKQEHQRSGVQNLRRSSMESISSSRGLSKVKSSISVTSQIFQPNENNQVSGSQFTEITSASEPQREKSILKSFTPRRKQLGAKPPQVRYTPQNRRSTVDESYTRAKKLILQQFNISYLLQQLQYVDSRDVSTLDKAMQLLGEAPKQLNKLEPQLDMLYQIIIIRASAELQIQQAASQNSGKMFLTSAHVKMLEQFCRSFKISVLSVDQFQIQQLITFLLRVQPYLQQPNKFIKDVILSMKQSLTEKYYMQLLRFEGLKEPTMQLVLALLQQFTEKNKHTQDQLWVNMITCLVNNTENTSEYSQTVKAYCDYIQQNIRFRDSEAMRRFLLGNGVPDEGVDRALLIFQKYIPDVFQDVRQQINEASKSLEQSLNAIKIELSNIDNEPSDLLKTQDLQERRQLIDSILGSQATPDTIEMAIKQIDETGAPQTEKLLSWTIENLRPGNEYDNGLIFAMLEREQDKYKENFSLTERDMQSIAKYWLSDQHGRFENIIFTLFKTQLEEKLDLVALLKFFEAFQAQTFVQEFCLQTLCEELIVDKFTKFGVSALQTELQDFLVEVQGTTQLRTDIINLIDRLLRSL